MTAVSARGADPGPGMLRAWLLASRPRTLPVSLVPVLVGSALAYAGGGRFRPSVLLVAALCAALIQVATNLHNDVADYERGADDPVTRIGPRRATAEGWLTPTQVRRGAALIFGIAFCIGQYLVYLAGWPIFVVGVVSILAGYAYSSGPRPIAYTSLGEVFVLVFFGWVAVGGTWFAHTQAAPGLLVVLAGAAVGLPAAAVLVVNNTRDVEDDRRAGRRTFPVVFGTSASRLEYAAFVVASPLLAAWTALGAGAGGWALACLVTLPSAIRLTLAFGRAASGAAFNELLGATARYGLLTGAVLVGVLAATA